MKRIYDAGYDAGVQEGKDTAATAAGFRSTEGPTPLGFRSASARSWVKPTGYWNGSGRISTLRTVSRSEDGKPAPAPTTM